LREIEQKKQGGLWGILGKGGGGGGKDYKRNPLGVEIQRLRAREERHNARAGEATRGLKRDSPKSATPSGSTGERVQEQKKQKEKCVCMINTLPGGKGVPLGGQNLRIEEGMSKKVIMALFSEQSGGIARGLSLTRPKEKRVI